MNLIDDENYVSERLHLIDKPLHSCLELSPELRSGDDRGHINKMNLLAPEPERHVTCDDLNCKRLGNGGLSERFAGGVDDVPSAVKRLFFCHKSRHEISSDKVTFFQPHNYSTVLQFCQAFFQKKSGIFKITFKCSSKRRFSGFFLAFSPPRNTKNTVTGCLSEYTY